MWFTEFLHVLNASARFKADVVDKRSRRLPARWRRQSDMNVLHVLIDNLSITQKPNNSHTNYSHIKFKCTVCKIPYVGNDLVILLMVNCVHDNTIATN